jgi:hypothetical protein
MGTPNNAIRPQRQKGAKSRKAKRGQSAIVKARATGFEGQLCVAGMELPWGSDRSGDGREVTGQCGEPGRGGGAATGGGQVETSPTAGEQSRGTAQGARWMLRPARGPGELRSERRGLGLGRSWGGRFSGQASASSMRREAGKGTPTSNTVWGFKGSSDTLDGDPWPSALLGGHDLPRRGRGVLSRLRQNAEGCGE